MSIDLLKTLLKFEKDELKLSDEKWSSVQNELNILFPEDYKEIISLLGSGAVNDFLWIFSPFSSNANLNLINKFYEIRDSYEYMKKNFPEKFSLEYYNGERGIFPWGITDNGDELYWNFKDDSAEILVYASRYSSMMKYKMNLLDFLIGVLSKKIYCDIFPKDFVLDENYYVAID